jgi:hypothetical protein
MCLTLLRCRVLSRMFVVPGGPRGWLDGGKKRRSRWGKYIVLFDLMYSFTSRMFRVVGLFKVILKSMFSNCLITSIAVHNSQNNGFPHSKISRHMTILKINNNAYNLSHWYFTTYCLEKLIFKRYQL